MKAVAGSHPSSTVMGAPLRPVRLGSSEVMLEHRADGSILVRPATSLGPYPQKITERLAHWASATPDRTCLAERGSAGGWARMSYAEVAREVQHIGQGLLRRQLSPERPILVLSGNAIDHALLGLAAMTVGIPYAPVSPAYSLMSTDFAKLRSIVALLTPGLVYADNGAAFERAIAAAIPVDIEVVASRHLSATRKMTAFSELREQPSRDLAVAEAAVGSETIAKFLFTSGSTGVPKAVINTQRMLCANQSMIASRLLFLEDEPPVVLDWLPWSHTFGGNHNFNMVLQHGGTLYIDDGSPTPAGIAKTAANLCDVSPTIYFNVPKGFDALLPFLAENPALRRSFFARLKAMSYGGASLNERTWKELQRLSIETCGERVIILSSLGSTETAPAALTRTNDQQLPGNIGLPLPGVELKLVPNLGKLEARLKGPGLTPGYWRQEQLSRDALDEEGFYRLGDALKFVDADDPQQGLLFDGRIAEDFKLSTGTWVSVGPLRERFINHFAPYVRDVVIAGADRDAIAALVFPDVEACRKLCPELPPTTAAEQVLQHPRLRGRFASGLTELAATNPGSSTRIARMLLVERPPSLDQGEMTDKGSVNQRAILNNRAYLLQEVFASPPPASVITLAERG